MTDPFQGKEWEHLEAQAREMFEQVKASAMVMTINPGGDPDVKVMLETGAGVLLDKPFIVWSPGDRPVPDNLRRLAHVVIEGELDDPRVQREFAEAIRRFS